MFPIPKKSLLVAGLALSGCNSMQEPVIHTAMVTRVPWSNEHIVHALATTSDRRVVLVEYRSQGGGNDVARADTIVCMEPPPDATESVNAQLNASLGGTLSGPEAPITASAAGVLTSSLASVVAHVTQPSQGILLYRAGMADLCNGLMNNFIGQDSQEQEFYEKESRELRKYSAALTIAELVLNNGKIRELPLPASSPGETVAPEKSGNDQNGDSVTPPPHNEDTLTVVVHRGAASEASVPEPHPSRTSATKSANTNSASSVSVPQAASNVPANNLTQADKAAIITRLIDLVFGPASEVSVPPTASSALAPAPVSSAHVPSQAGRKDKLQSQSSNDPRG